MDKVEKYVKEQIERINNIIDPTPINLGERYAYENVLIMIRRIKIMDKVEKYVKEQIERINNIIDPTPINLGERYAYENVLIMIWKVKLKMY